jgi:hypothetical protein
MSIVTLQDPSDMSVLLVNTEEEKKQLEESGDVPEGKTVKVKDPGEGQPEDRLSKTEKLFKQYEEGMQGQADVLQKAAEARRAAAPAGVARALGATVGAGGTGMVGGSQLRQAASAAESAQKAADVEAASFEARGQEARAEAALGLQEAGAVASEATKAIIDDMNTELWNEINSSIATHKGSLLEDDDEDAMYDDIVGYLQTEYGTQMGGQAASYKKYLGLKAGDPDPLREGMTVTQEQIEIAKVVAEGYKQADRIKTKEWDV